MVEKRQKSIWKTSSTVIASLSKFHTFSDLIIVPGEYFTQSTSPEDNFKVYNQSVSNRVVKLF